MWSPVLKKLPLNLKRILKVARKHNLRWEILMVSAQITNQLPAWFHIGASEELNKLNNCYYAACLRENHEVTSVQHISDIANRNDLTHRKHIECSCNFCSEDRNNLKCAKPFKCAQLAKDMMECILPKWNPNTTTQSFNPDLTSDQIIAKEKAIKKNEVVLFNPKIPSPSSVEGGFRIFTCPESQSKIPAKQDPPTSVEIQHPVRAHIASTH
ncbi:hypothetical protein F4604DRAFT_1599718 [Suillus subluteus]|nr:hypothetical protein F4604DRAFT_1599718 [Suillus subluteus]